MSAIILSLLSLLPLMLMLRAPDAASGSLAVIFPPGDVGHNDVQQDLCGWRRAGSTGWVGTNCCGA